MKLSKEEARTIVWNDNDDWVTVENKIVDNSRWSIMHEGVFHHVSTKKCYKTYWSVGATEQQDESPFEYDEPEFTEVKLVEKVVKIWESV